MERTKHTNTPATNLLVQLASRMALASSLGTQQYGGDRDIYQALGYKKQLIYNDFYVRYKRQDIAKAVIDRPAIITWSGKLTITEEENTESDFSKAWDTLNIDLKLKSRLIRLDKLSAIGAYGVLLLGFDDVTNVEGFKRPVSGGKRKLLYVKPYGQGSAKVKKLETDTRSERFGLPLIYSLESEQTDVENPDLKLDSVIEVHYTRVLHIASDLLESEVYGSSKLESVFNRLMDLEKLVGGDAEMFWRGARPGYSGKVDPDFMMTEDTKKELKEQIDEYENNLRRIFVNEGVSLEALAQQIADPKNHVDVQIAMISAITGIPKRILIGSERGELSSGQDRSEWLSFVETRRMEYAEPIIVRPFVDALIEYNVLPTPSNDKYVVRWEDLLSLTEKDRVEIGKSRSVALREYTANPVASAMMPFEAFIEYFLGLSDLDVMKIKKMQKSEIGEEQQAWQEMRDALAMPAPTDIKKSDPTQQPEQN